MAMFDGVTPRGVYIKHCQRLGCRKNAQLLKSLSDSPDGFNRLTEFNLTHNLIGRVGFKAVLEVIRIAYDLRRLCLANNGLDDSSVLLLLPVIKDHQHLAYLDLSSNPLGRHCGAQIVNFVKECPNIQWLLLDETIILQSMLKLIEQKTLENRRRVGQYALPAEPLDGPGPVFPASVPSKRKAAGAISYHSQSQPLYMQSASQDTPQGAMIRSVPMASPAFAPAVPPRRRIRLQRDLDPPDHVRQVLADEGRWKNAARCLYLEADESGIGSLTTIELGLVLHAVVQRLGLLPPPTQEVAVVLDLMDSNRSGRLTEDEFVYAVRSYLLRRAKASGPASAGMDPLPGGKPWSGDWGRGGLSFNRGSERSGQYINGSSMVLEELSAELLGPDRQSPEATEQDPIMQWLDEAKNMGGVNTYAADASGITLDDLDQRLAQQQSRRGGDRQRRDEGRGKGTAFGDLDWKLRRKHEEEQRLNDAYRRQEELKQREASVGHGRGRHDAGSAPEHGRRRGSDVVIEEDARSKQEELRAQERRLQQRNAELESMYQAASEGYQRRHETPDRPQDPDRRGQGRHSPHDPPFRPGPAASNSRQSSVSTHLTEQQKQEFMAWLFHSQGREARGQDQGRRGSGSRNVGSDPPAAAAAAVEYPQHFGLRALLPADISPAEAGKAVGGAISLATGGGGAQHTGLRLLFGSAADEVQGGPCPPGERVVSGKSLALPPGAGVRLLASSDASPHPFMDLLRQDRTNAGANAGAEGVRHLMKAAEGSTSYLRYLSGEAS